MLQSQSTESRRDFLVRVALSPIVFQVGTATLASAAEQPLIDARSRIIKWIFDGGLSQEIWDPKPNAPTEVRGSLGHIATSIPGVRFSEVSPKLAQRADTITLLRTVTSPSEFHDDSTDHLLWTDDKTHYLPDHGKAMSAPIPFAYLESSFPGKGDGLSWEHNRVRSMNDEVHDTPERLQLAMVDGRIVMPNENVDAQRLRGRLRLLETLQDQRVVEGKAVALAEQMRTLAERILLGDFIDAADIDTRLTESFGDTQMGQAGMIALALSRAGIGSVALRTGHWDFHENIDKMHAWRFPDADRAIAAQIDAIEQAGDDTVVCVTTEFGRSPVINEEGGRHHWKQAHSEIFYGGHFPRGKVVGSTNMKWRREDDGIPLRDIKHLVVHAAGGEVKPDNYKRVGHVFEE